MLSQEKPVKQLIFGVYKAKGHSFCTVQVVPSEIVTPSAGLHVFTITRDAFKVGEIKSLLKAAKLQKEPSEVIRAIEKFIR
jgi:hypothetical protein